LTAILERPRITPLRFTFDDMRELWPVMEPLIAKACEHSGGRYDVNAVAHAVYVGEMVLFGVACDRDVRALVACAHMTWPTGLRTAEAVLMGAEEGAGRLEDGCWDALIDNVLQWAVAAGSDRLVAHGRSGFKRRLKARGLDVRVTSELMETDI
jgi:hypothetical protein